MLKFRFNGTDGVMVEADKITSGMTGKVAKFEFSSEWDDLQKTAVFMAGPTTKDVLNVTDEAIIPHEVLQNYGDRLYVGIYGVSGDGTVTPTIYARGPRISRGADPSGDESTDPTLPVWAQLQAQIDDLKNGGTGGGSSSDSTQSANNTGWTTAQINLLNSLFDYIPWTSSGAGAIADSLIASLRSTSSGDSTGDGSGGETEDSETDDITQSGSTLIITSLATVPTQSGSVLAIA